MSVNLIMSLFIDKIRESLSSVALGDLEITPVSAAIARHLGIDLSPDGKAARNRRGVAIIVHGAPMSGKLYVNLFRFRCHNCVGM